MNDLYFTGTLTPGKRKSSSGEDMVAVDTGIKLFSKEEIMEARRKMAERCTYDSAKGRNDMKSQFLPAGFLKCGECGRTVGPHTSKRKKGPPLRCYRCRGYSPSNDLCSQKKGYEAKVLEFEIWGVLTELIETSSLKEAILEEEFIQDADRDMLESLILRARKELEGIQEEENRLLYQHQKGFLNDERLDEEMGKVSEARFQAEEELRKAKEQLEGFALKNAIIEKSTELFAQNEDLVRHLNDLIDELTQLHHLPKSLLAEDELEEVDHKVKTLWKETENILKLVYRDRSDLIPEWSSVDDLDDEKILSLWGMDETNRLIFEQKRSILKNLLALGAVLS